MYRSITNSHYTFCKWKLIPWWYGGLQLYLSNLLLVYAIWCPVHIVSRRTTFRCLHMGYGMCLETEDSLILVYVIVVCSKSSINCITAPHLIPIGTQRLEMCATTSGFPWVLRSKPRFSCMHSLCQLEIYSQKLRTELPLGLILLGLLLLWICFLNFFNGCLRPCFLQMPQLIKSRLTVCSVS